MVPYPVRMPPIQAVPCAEAVMAGLPTWVLPGLPVRAVSRPAPDLFLFLWEKKGRKKVSFFFSLLLLKKLWGKNPKKKR